jgi:hypothetical protein
MNWALWVSLVFGLLALGLFVKALIIFDWDCIGWYMAAALILGVSIGFLISGLIGVA